MMPVWKVGTCCCCGCGLASTTFIMGYLDGKIYTGWVCAACHNALARIREEEKVNRGGSESQERNPEEINNKGQEEQDDDDAGKQR